MAGNLIGMDRPAVPGIAAVVVHRVSIENFAPFTRLIDAKAVIVTRHRREVAGDDNFVPDLIATDKNQY